MNRTAWQVHKGWFVRAALVLLVTVLANGIVVWLAQRPIVWATLIGSSLPFTMLLFVWYPLHRDERRAGR